MTEFELRRQYNIFRRHDESARPRTCFPPWSHLSEEKREVWKLCIGGDKEAFIKRMTSAHRRRGTAQADVASRNLMQVILKDHWLNCPFCGCAAWLDNLSDATGNCFAIACCKCSGTVLGDTIGEVVSLWNRRVSFSHPTARN